MRSFLKYRLLLWKNFLIQRRKPITTAIEIGLPTLFSLILMVLRLRVDSTLHPSVTYWNDCNYAWLDSELQKLKLAYTPFNNATERLMNRVSWKVKLPIVPFNSEDELVAAATNTSETGSSKNTQYLAGVVFQSGFKHENGSLLFESNVKYKLRFSYSPRVTSDIGSGFKGDQSWSTRFNFPPFQIVGPRKVGANCNGDPGYKREGFLAVQHAVDDAFMHEFLTETALKEYNETTISLRRHPYPPYKDDKFVLVLQQQFPMVVMLSLVVLIMGIVRDIVLEKERRLKESMKMMGINNWLHWLAWFTKHFSFLLISVLIMTLFYCIKLDSEKGGVVAQTNPFVIFLYLICYSIASITFCYAISVFFSKANTGAIIGGIMFFCMYIPYFFLQQRYTTLSLSSKFVACFDFQVAMSFGGTLLGMFEGVGSGIQLSTLNKGVSVDDDFTMAMVLFMLLVDSVIHILFVWYIEGVFPGEYGVPQPWYFPFSPVYWGCKRVHTDYIEIHAALNVGQNPEMFEKEPNERAGIQIKNLRKVYGKGSSKKVAVAGMTLNMYEGQITALLGHNGAGKTTTMSMLTGFYPPTHGTAIVNGYDICREISEVRSSLGLCPQHDILFDNLTVKEHMIFFGLLKGVAKERIMPECEEMLQDMELYPKLNAKSKTLSGGMKRKLSVCIALIGNSKVVFLDEPSSGLDPNARRNIWTVLQKSRAGRTMVLSTHFMDEADLLGDRIAIMANGIVKCCGSSLFLKKKYGAGYHMVVVKEPNCSANLVTAVIQSHIGEAELESNVGAELSFVLPQHSVSKFEGLFQELEDRQQELGISSFGASVTTMEEVFLKVGEAEDESIKVRLTHQNVRPINGSPDGERRNITYDSIPVHNGGPGPASSSTPRTTGRGVTLDFSDDNVSWSPAVLNLSQRLPKNTGSTVYFQQFYAMFVKRVLHTRRNKLITLTQLIVPLFFSVMGIVVLKTLPDWINMPALVLSPAQYGSNYIPYSSSLSSFEDAMMAKAYKKHISSYPKVHPTYVNNETGFKNDPDLMKYLVEMGEAGIGVYNLRYMVAAEFNRTKNGLKKVTAFFNNQAYHSIATSFGEMYNGLLYYFTNSSEYSIETTNHPLPRLTSDKLRDQENLKDITGFTLGFNICFGMAFLASSFVLFLVKERTVKAKHIQFVSGVHPLNFWISTFAWDVINYLIPCLCIIITFFIFSIKQYTDDNHWLHLILFFLFYGWAMLPFMYFFSFAFSVPATAYVWITMFNIVTGVLCLLIVVILSIPQIDLQNISNLLEWIFLALFPNFSLAQGFFEYFENYQTLELCSEISPFCPFIKFLNKTNPCCPGNCGGPCLSFNENYLGWEKNGIGRMLFFLGLQGVLFWSLIFLHEFGWLRKVYYKLRPNKQETMPHGVYSSQMSADSIIQEDEDVARERSRIDNADSGELLSQSKLLLDNLTKYYGKFRAVDHLSVGIPPGECFGLLGINGAGKTSTFMMLSGDSIISSGEAYIDSYSLKTQKDMARKRLGYCPQFDALIGQLTGREILTLFARLRGVKEKTIPTAVYNLMHAMTLTQYADKLCQTYSGGNKRKLSTAIALIGDPDVIFLDEPTTGMDPVARRMLWEVLSAVRDSGRTLVLTSHNMEECEALCTRLAIMVNGQFKCLGSIQHLKNKFGEGYTFNAKVAYPTDGSELDLTPLRDFMDSTFPKSKLTDVHENMVNYHITDTRLTWAQVFGELERAKDKLHIEDYLISQTSLEQVFIYFARMQKEPGTHHEETNHPTTSSEAVREQGTPNEYSRLL